MDQTTIFQPNADLAKSAHIDAKTYETLYTASINNPNQFWAEQGQRMGWIKPYTLVSDVSYKADDLHIKWYADGTLNAAANYLTDSRCPRGSDGNHLGGRQSEDHRTITYRELHNEVCKFSNVLSKWRPQGDRITILCR